MSPTNNHLVQHAPPAKAIMITVRGHLSSLAPGWPESVLRVLEPQRSSDEPSGNGQAYYRIDSRGHLLIPAGLMPRVKAELDRLGVPVSISDRTPWLNRPSADWLPEGGDEMHTELLQFLRQLRGNSRGQIVIQHNDSRICLIATICKCFPTARIFVVAATRARVARLGHQLQPLLDRPMTWGDREPWSMPVWLHVATAYWYIQGFNIDWDMVIFADVESALARQSLETADRACDAYTLRYQNRYCFVPASRRLHSDSRLQLEAIVGPEIYREPTSIEPLRDVRVLLAHAPLVPAATSYDSPLERKRRLIWNNASRNTAVAAIAQAFVEKDMPALWSNGLLFDVADNAVFQWHELSVAIVVESPEHGRHLLQLLPGWRLADMIPSVERQRPTPMPCGHRTIATWEKARRVGCSADVIIRADGTGTPWHPRFGPYRASAYAAGNLLIVDFQDDVDRQAQHDTRRRQDDYAAHGLLPGSHGPGRHAAIVQPGYREELR